MRSILRTLPYISTKPLMLMMAFGVSMVITSFVFANTGPERPTKAYQDNNTSFAYPTFNSITNAPQYGDERDFLRSTKAGSGQDATDNTTNVADGDVVTVYTYYHNNASQAGNADGSAVAKDVSVNIDLPSNAGKQQEIAGYITASNTIPNQIWDTARISGSEDFTLEYVPGSAKLVNSGLNTALSDEIINNGAQIGSHGLDGRVKAGFDYVGTVSFELKINMVRPNPADIALAQQVRVAGSDDWASSVDAEPGDTLEYRVAIANSSDRHLNSVQIHAQLSDDLNYVAGSTKLNNQSNADITGSGFSMSNVPAGQTDYLTYSARVASADDLACGNHSLDAEVMLNADGISEKSAISMADVDNDCDEPAPATVSDCELTIAFNRDTDRTITATATTNPSGSNATVNWDFGDEVTRSGTKKVTHTYQKDGTYTVSAAIRENGKTTRCNLDVTVTTERGRTLGATKTLPNTGNTGTAALISLIGSSIITSAGYGLIMQRKRF